MKKPINKLLITCLLLVMLPPFLEAKVKLPRLVSDGMVLQRDTKLIIWGWASPSEKVKVEFAGKTCQTIADKQGNWKAELPPAAAGGPFNMKVNEIEIHDILIGDVWLCSGQSNMELPVRRVLDLYNDEIQNVNNTDIRLFRSSVRKDFQTPQTDYSDGSWLPATRENIMDFSAVAYFFASEVYRKYKVPVGLISTAIGGSPAESWLSEAPAKKYLVKWMEGQARIDSILASEKLKEGNEKHFNWFEELNRNDPGVSKWSKTNVNVSDWPLISLPGYWTEKGVDMQYGSIWFYKEFEIPDSLANKEAVLRLGRIIDSDSAFVNGTFVGTISYQYPPRIYKIHPDVLKPGKNKLMVRVISQNGNGGFVEEKPYKILIGSQVIDLTGDWKYHTGAIMRRDSSLVPLQFRPGGLYNGLINPITGFQLKGVIWYQGESNTGRAKEYAQLFQDLISDWRIQFKNPYLPFLYVQLANLGRPEKKPAENGWAELRESQRQALQLLNTGMAVTYDIGEWNDIHPLNKKEVARRLALESVRVAYHDSSVVSSGPLYESMEISDKSIILTFKSVGSGLFTNCFLEGFQIAGTDGQFVWANAVVISKNKVRVWSKSVTSPTTVRYAWEGNPAGANLKNKEGLPASPFITHRQNDLN
jgi:sialate O-acetylesterase